ncbi:hypothetical protein GCM10011297_18000 [Bacterioplanes sanyensis]|nr:hypothetical protein GCM10011297_18000 [Bacterioplanes sanyensis]
MVLYTKAPDIYEFVGFFEQEPVRCEEVEFEFRYGCGGDLELVFSFNLAQTSVQAVLVSRGNTIACVCKESVSEIKLSYDRDGFRVITMLSYENSEFKESFAVTLDPLVSINYGQIRG